MLTTGPTTNKTPFISVLMPVYNAKRYVAEAVRSILAQTFADFELIIIDDGSTDGSRAILEDLAAGDSRIRLVSRENRGLVATLNELMGMARADLVARMDADDVAIPERFEWQVEFLRDHPEVVCLGGFQHHIDSEGRYLYLYTCPLGDPEIQDQMLLGHCEINHPSVMMRREVALAVGGYRAEMEHLEDLDLWLRMGERGQLANLDRVITRYRVHEKSKSEQFQREHAGFIRRISDEACDRRGIPRRHVPLPPFRPMGCASKHAEWVGYGWLGFNRGDRTLARVYGLKAVRLMPWRTNGWRLLACALVKKPVGRAT